jgi:hypothetical protein
LNQTIGGFGFHYVLAAPMNEIQMKALRFVVSD